MKSRTTLLPALIVTCVLLASAGSDARPLGSPSGPGQKASLSHPPAQDAIVENWILIGIILVGFGVLTLRMVRYRREMEKSVLRRLRHEWTAGRALLKSGRSFLKEAFDSGAFSDRRATPRNGERQARAS